MPEVLLAFLTAPLAAFLFLISAAWWVGILFVIMCGTSAYQIRSDETLNAFAIFLIAIIGSAFASQYLGSDVGVWEAFKLSLSMILPGLLYYAGWGLLSILPLWILEALRFKRKYRDAKVKFKQRVKDEERLPKGSRNSQTAETDEEFHSRLWSYCLSDAGLRTDLPLSAKSKEGIWTISSFFFLWPIHLIDRVFGELLKQIPEILSMMFGSLLDRVTKMITGDSTGRPSA